MAISVQQNGLFVLILQIYFLAHICYIEYYLCAPVTACTQVAVLS